jgi:GH24 family phage-related lysozyme (muramidase)
MINLNAMETTTHTKLLIKKWEGRDYVNNYAKYENHVKSFNIPLEQHQFDALVSFTYNRGSIKDTMREHLIEKDFYRMLLKMSKYVYDNGRYMRGLQIRRNVEILIFLDKPVDIIKLKYMDRQELDDFIINEIKKVYG